MDDILDSLFGALPVLIGVIWLIRMFGRRKNRNKSEDSDKAEQKGVMSRRKSGKAPSEQPFPGQPFPGQAAAAGKPSGTVNEEGKLRRRRTLEEVMARVNDFAENAGEQAQYEKPAPRRVGPPPTPAKQKAETTVQLVAGTENAGEEAAAYTGDTGPSSLERLSALPPLAQGILWSTILGEPVGMKDPLEERR